MNECPNCNGLGIETVNCRSCGGSGERKDYEQRTHFTGSKSLASVLDERVRQEQKWGEQNHDPFCYLTILVEEVGEFAQAALHTKFGGKHGGLDHLREEAVHTAAVALAIVECLDRGKWVWDETPPEEKRGG